jgi:hypothetical protein
LIGRSFKVKPTNRNHHSTGSLTNRKQRDTDQSEIPTNQHSFHHMPKSKRRKSRQRSSLSSDEDEIHDSSNNESEHELPVPLRNIPPPEFKNQSNIVLSDYKNKQIRFTRAELNGSPLYGIREFEGTPSRGYYPTKRGITVHKNTILAIIREKDKILAMFKSPKK